MTQKLKKPLKELNLLDRFLFAEVMEDTGAYEAALEIILQREIRLKDKTQSEKEIRTLPSFRGIRLDVWGEDEEDNIYNSEMQKADTKNLPRRIRFYQSVIDAGNLEAGVTDFNELNDICLITIMPFDLFGEDRCVYTFRMRCDESPDLALDDGAVRMFLYTRGKNKEGVSEELQAFLKYVEHSDGETADLSDSERMKQIHERVTRVKQNEVSEVKYMQLWEEMAMERNDGIAEGIKLGEERGLELGEKRGIELGEKRGLELGEKRGLEEGSRRMRTLTKQLLEQKQYEELEKAAEDPNYCQALMEKYKI